MSCLVELTQTIATAKLRNHNAALRRLTLALVWKSSKLLGESRQYASKVTLMTGETNPYFVSREQNLPSSSPLICNTQF